MSVVEKVLRVLRLIPDQKPAGEQENERLSVLREADVRREEKIELAEQELKKPSRRRMSEEDFFRMLESKGGGDVDEDA